MCVRCTFSTATPRSTVFKGSSGRRENKFGSRKKRLKNGRRQSTTASLRKQDPRLLITGSASKRMRARWQSSKRRSVMKEKKRFRLSGTTIKEVRMKRYKLDRSSEKAKRKERYRRHATPEKQRRKEIYKKNPSPEKGMKRLSYESDVGLRQRKIQMMRKYKAERKNKNCVFFSADRRIRLALKRVRGESKE